MFEEEKSEQISYLKEEESQEFITINADKTIKYERSKVFVNNATNTYNIDMPNVLEIELQSLADDKELQLLTPLEYYKNQYTEMYWTCLKCNQNFSATRKAVKKNKHPCPNCREHKGGVQREKISDNNIGDLSKEGVLSEILREAFRKQLHKGDISNSELGRLLKYEIKQALKNKTKFSRWIIYRFIKSVNKLLTNANRKTALKALKEDYGYVKGYFLDVNDFNKPESDLGFNIWNAFSNELDDDTLTGDQLGIELDRDINSILRHKSRISISVYLKLKSICKEKLQGKNRSLALDNLKGFGKIRNYIVEKDAPIYLELRLAKKLWKCFTDQYENNNLTFSELSRELYHEDFLNENLRVNKRFDDSSLDDFERAIKQKLKGNNYDKAMRFLIEYRQKRSPIHVYTDKQRQNTSESMTKKWTDEDYLKKMQLRPKITGEDHHRWNPNRDLIIKDILDFDNPELKTMTQIAEKHGVGITHVRDISINEVEGIYSDYSHKERFPADFFSLIGHEIHWIIKYILTSFFLDLGFKIYSEIIIDLIDKFAVDQLLLNIKDHKYLSKRLKNDAFLTRKLFIRKLNTIIAFLFEYTNDISDENIEAKKGKYQKDNMILFIVGTRWPRRNNQDTLNTGYTNIMIIKHDLFSRLIGLKGKYLNDYEHAITLSYNADLDGLKDFHNRIKEEFISKYGTELSINRYKTGLFYNDDLKNDLKSMGINFNSFFG